MFADDPSFWFETVRALSHTAYGGADIGEVLTIAQAIVDGDYDSWHDEWLAMADRISAEADKALAAGHRISARDGLMRASNYYRSAEFYLHGNPDDPRIQHAFERARECFRTAAGLLDPPVQPVAIPFEGTVLHGYFYRALNGGTAATGARPTVIMHSGFDGSYEEMHWLGAAAAQERGYHVLTFDGPGQPAARRLDGLVFRPDWENVVTPVLDWLLERREVDRTRVALLGASMGGLLAPRAAAFEHRLAACVALDGVYDMGLLAKTYVPGTDDEVRAALLAETAPDIDSAIEQLTAANPVVRWATTHGRYVTGAPSPRAFLATFLDYTLADGVAERIGCPTLVCDAEDDLFFAGQPRLLFDHLTCEKTFIEFSNAEGAAAHCHPGAQRLASARIYDWLDDVLGVSP